MTDPALPRDGFGWPYQPIVSFEGDRITRLVYDREGHVMAYRNTAEGDPLVEDETWQRAPNAVATAAVESWEEWRRSHP
jgi:hypothetical protein